MNAQAKFDQTQKPIMRKRRQQGTREARKKKASADKLRMAKTSSDNVEEKNKHKKQVENIPQGL